MILGKDRLCCHGASIEFNPTVLTVNGERMPLERPPEGSMSVVVEEDIRIPTRTAVFERGRLVTGKKIRKEVL